MSLFIMTDHVIDLLPWYLNGRINADDRAKVMQHLQQCERCAAELNMQKHLQTAINAPVKVEIAPQPSFNKLWERVVAEENADVDAAIKPTSNHISPLQQFACWLQAQWMPVILATHMAVIVAGGIFFVKHETTNTNAAYRTVSTTTPTQGAVFHVVFDDATRLTDIKDILLRSNLQVISGPTAAGVYSLSPMTEQAAVDIKQTVKSLRDDPRVRFAEISHE